MLLFKKNLQKTKNKNYFLDSKYFLIFSDPMTLSTTFRRSGYFSNNTSLVKFGKIQFMKVVVS